MKSALLSITFLLLAITALAQSQKEQTLPTTIKAVTVYQAGAQIVREGAKNLPSGESTLRIKGLSQYIDAKSIRVKITGAGKLLSLQHELNYLSEQQQSARVDSLYQAIKAAVREVKGLDARIEVLQKREELLSTNQLVIPADGRASLTDLKETMQYYEQQYTAIRQERLSIEESKAALAKQIVKLRGQIVVIDASAAETTGEIILKVEATRAASLSFAIDYVVQNAGWTPSYDVRVADVASPLELTCKASVYQNTGVEWRDVTLTLSNANPNESGIKPELEKWTLTLQRWTRQMDGLYGYSSMQGQVSRLQMQQLGNNTIQGRVVDNDGEGLPGVNVVVKGTTQGTVTDLDGYFSINTDSGSRLVFSFIGFESKEVIASKGYMMVNISEDVKQLSEVVVTAMGASRRDRYEPKRDKVEERPVYTQREVIERQTTIEYLVDRPYSIASTGEPISVELEVLNMDAIYEYYAVPKLDKDAFLVARVPGWNEYMLPAGIVNLYFEDAYIGESILEANSTLDTLDLSLGRDESIIITRDKKKEYSKRSFIGSNQTESRAFHITVRNRKSQDIKLTIYDQTPVSVYDKIDVTLTESSAAEHKEDKGQLTWTFDLPAGQQKELDFAYEVKYPKGENVLLE